MKKITPNVTGFPVTHKTYIRQAASAVIWAMIWSFLVILVLLIVDFKRLDGVLLALLPLFIGMMWIQSVMYIAKINYNVANIAGLPLLLGLGVVYGLRMVHRWKEDTKVTAFAATKTTGRGLAFAALAILIGLGSIVPARHNGVSAFGLVLLFGIISCLFTALVILPAVIDLIYVIRNKEALQNENLMKKNSIEAARAIETHTADVKRVNQSKKKPSRTNKKSSKKTVKKSKKITKKKK